MAVANPLLTKHQVLDRLRAEERALRADYFVKSLALFGSVARNQAAATSDVDLLVEFDRPIGLLHLVGTALFIEKLLNVQRVDLVPRESILPELKEVILGEALDVFTASPLEVPSPAHA